MITYSYEVIGKEVFSDVRGGHGVVCAVGICERHHKSDGGGVPDADGAAGGEGESDTIRLLWRLRHDGGACGPVHPSLQL